MKKGLLLTMLLISMIATARDKAVLQLMTELGRFDTLSADFQQSIKTGNASSVLQSKGKMALKRPGKFYWQTITPTSQVLIADGKHVWIYDVDLEQVTRQKQKKHDMNSPAIFLTGDVKQLPKRFHVKRENELYHLTAKSGDDMFQRIDIRFKASKLQKMVVQTKLGQTSEFEFQRVELNPVLSTDTFAFVPPRGVDVIYNE